MRIIFIHYCTQNWFLMPGWELSTNNQCLLLWDLHPLEYFCRNGYHSAVLKLECASESLGGRVKMQTTRKTLWVSDSVGLRWGLTRLIPQVILAMLLVWTSPWRNSAVWRENWDILLPNVQDAASLGDQSEQASWANVWLEKPSQLSTSVEG